MFFRESESSVPTITRSELASIVAITSAVKPGGVSAITKSYVPRATTRTSRRSSIVIALAWSGRAGARRTSHARVVRHDVVAAACPRRATRPRRRGRTSSSRAEGPRQSPTSPNWRSRSMMSTFCPASASATARLHEVSVLPVPPFGPRTQMSRPSWLLRRAGVLARRPRDGLAHREAKLILRLREEGHVGRPGVERATQEPVRARTSTARGSAGPGSTRWAPSMMWSDRSSSRPWQATRRTSTSRVCSVRTVSSTPSVDPMSSKFGSSGRLAGRRRHQGLRRRRVRGWNDPCRPTSVP